MILDKGEKLKSFWQFLTHSKCMSKRFRDSVHVYRKFQQIYEENP